MMNVRDFIAQVSQNVVNGILDAQKEVDSAVALVSPTCAYQKPHPPCRFIHLGHAEDTPAPTPV